MIFRWWFHSAPAFWMMIASAFLLVHGIEGSKWSLHPPLWLPGSCHSFVHVHQQRPFHLFRVLIAKTVKISPWRQPHNRTGGTRKIHWFVNIFVNDNVGATCLMFRHIKQTLWQGRRRHPADVSCVAGPHRLLRLFGWTAGRSSVCPGISWISSDS